MKISTVTNSKRVGQIKLHPSHPKKLMLEVDPLLSRSDLKSNVGRVYFLTVDGVIKKIGGSQCKGGIQGTIAAYLGGFAPKMSPRSYCGWNYIRQHIMNGSEVEFYFILAPMTKAKIPSMSSFDEIEIPVDFHQIEHACVQEYLQAENDYPELNVQESGKKWRDMRGPIGRLLEGFPAWADSE
jgi:hypothetical protein